MMALLSIRPIIAGEQNFKRDRGVIGNEGNEGASPFGVATMG
jgi:hypothetical protein